MPPPPRAVGPGPKRGRAPVIALVAVLAVLVMGGLAAGIIIWRVAEANRLVAKVESVELKRSDGKSLDLKDVPIDVELDAVVTFNARFPQGGKAVLKTVTKGSDEGDDRKREFKVNSSGKPQTRKDEITVNFSKGETFTVKADLEVSRGEKSVKGSGNLDFYVAEGKGIKKQVEEAVEKAKKKLEEAKAAVASLSGLPINTADLTQQLNDHSKMLENAETLEAANAEYDFGDKVIAECNARRAAYEAEQRRIAEEKARQQDIAAAKSVMFNYANAEKGNAESISLQDFSMNNERTSASATYKGMVTVHTDPDHAGQIDYFYVTAAKQGGQWVVTSFRYEFVQ